jgi:hypothetical protein
LQKIQKNMSWSSGNRKYLSLMPLFKTSLGVVKMITIVVLFREQTAGEAGLQPGEGAAG